MRLIVALGLCERVAVRERAEYGRVLEYDRWNVAETARQGAVAIA
jgi:hypothetical protein